MRKPLASDGKCWYDIPMDIDRITSATPVEIDTELAQLTHRMNEIAHGVERCKRLLKSDYISTAGRAEYEDSIIVLTEEAKRVVADIEPLVNEWNERRWSRFYLVTNGNGHVHSSTHCTTCYMNTSYAWLPQLSGASEDEAVEEYGEKMCTVCFPSAPANPKFHGPGRIDREAQAAKAAEKAEKLSQKLEKAILPDGSELPLKGLASWPKTLIAAQRTLASEVNSLLWYGDEHPMADDWKQNIATLVMAISDKTGEDAAAIQDAVFVKQAKKVAKEKAQ